MNDYQITSSKISFSCGCEFAIDGTKINFIVDIHNPKHTVNFKCPHAYQLISDGLTQGIFQLNSPLGTQWSKKVLPTNLEHLCALGSVLRPGCMNSYDKDGISTTIHYERRKNGKEQIVPYHPVIDEILKDTYSCMIYQEEAMAIAIQCAGFSLVEADVLRKNIGKKSVEGMQQSKKLFYEKAKTFGVLTDEQAIEVFNWIEASQRYAFCRAHAMAYGITSYVCAYIKSHFPIQFFKSWLVNESDRTQYAGFVNEAKLFDITVNPPNIQHFKTKFYSRKRNIYFGLSNIKGILRKDLHTIVQKLDELGWLAENLGVTVQWMPFLTQILTEISSKTAEGLIWSGALDCFDIARTRMWYDYEYYWQLTPAERGRCSGEVCLGDLVQKSVSLYEKKYTAALAKYNSDKEKRAASSFAYKTVLTEPRPNKRLKILNEIVNKLVKPSYIVLDNLDAILFAEEDLLGVALTKHSTDAIINRSETHTCLDIAEGYKGRALLRVKVEQAREYKQKNGLLMCFLEVSDQTCRLSNVMMFAGNDDEKGYSEYSYLLKESNVVFIETYASQKGGTIIRKVYPCGN